MLSEQVMKNKEPLSFHFILISIFTFLNFTHAQVLLPVLEGSHLPEIIIIAAFIFMLSSKEKTFELCLTSKLVIALLGFAILSLVDSIWIGRSIEIMESMYVKVVVVYFLMVFGITNIRQLRIFLKIIVWSSLYISIYAIVNYESGSYFKGIGWEKRIGGPPGIAGGSNDMALTLVMVIPLIFVMIYLAKKKTVKLVYLASVGAAIVAIVVSGSRGGFVAFVGMVLFSLITKVRKRVLPLVIILLLASPVIINILPHNYIGRLSTIGDIKADKTGSAQLRKRDMLRSIEVIREHPLNGVGFGVNSIALGYGDTTGFGGVHDAFLQVGADCGVPAMFIFIYLFYDLIKKMRAKSGQNQSSLNEYTNEIEAYKLGIFVSITAFATGAIFLPLAYRWCVYYLFALSVIILQLEKKYGSQ